MGCVGRGGGPGLSPGGVTMMSGSS
jgi:hypothetical protein